MGSIASIGIIGWIIFIIMGILLPFSAYAAQKWAYKTYKEAQKLNKTLEKMLDLAQSEILKRK